MNIRRRVGPIVILVLGILIISQFNNCSPTTSIAPFADQSALGACDPADPNLVPTANTPAANVNCALPNQRNLAITPSRSSITINGGIADFNIGGSCNPGGFPNNQVTWVLQLNNVQVRNSGYSGTTGSTVCKNGMFSMVVTLGPIVEDYVNRTGLSNGAGFAVPYTLLIQITGYDINNQAYQNQLNGNYTVNLFPL
jgi:hypothetical protein